MPSIHDNWDRIIARSHEAWHGGLPLGVDTVAKLVEWARLGKAWSEVEAALPEGWQWSNIQWTPSGWLLIVHSGAVRPYSVVTANGPPGDSSAGGLCIALEALRDQLPGGAA